MKVEKNVKYGQKQCRSVFLWQMREGEESIDNNFIRKSGRVFIKMKNFQGNISSAQRIALFEEKTNHKII